MQDQEVLQKLENLRSSYIIPEEGISIDQHNKELDAAEKRVKKGAYYTQEEVENMLKNEAVDFLESLSAKATTKGKRKTQRKAGLAKGLIHMKKGVDEPLDDFKEYM